MEGPKWLNQGLLNLENYTIKITLDKSPKNTLKFFYDFLHGNSVMMGDELSHSNPYN